MTVQRLPGYARVLVILATFGAAACSGAAQAPSSDTAEQTSPPSSPPQGEQLLAQPPSGWQQIGATSLPTLRRAEFIPDGEQAESPTRRITFEAMVEDPLPDPIGFVDALAADRQRECGTFERLPTFSGLENGYPTTVDLLICHHDRKTDQSEVMLMKAIRGEDAFYVITRGRRGPPLKKDEQADVEEVEIGAWAVYLRSISVCDYRGDTHPCPAASTPARQSE